MKERLKVEHLSVSFFTDEGEVQAVRDVSFSLNAGEVLAVVGESGCGKSVLCKSIMKLLPENAKIKNGKILVNGEEIAGYGERRMRELRGKLFSMVFQNPMTSLNPTMTVGAQIAEAVRAHQKDMGKEEVEQRVTELMQLVGIEQAEERKKAYPYHFSGGMRQRIVLAIALAGNPEILFADEPTTALDVTIQAQILDLLREIQKKLGTATVFVTHDLGVVARIADRVAVMYAGKIVEIGTVDEIFYDPVIRIRGDCCVPYRRFRGEKKACRLSRECRRLFSIRRKAMPLPAAMLMRWKLILRRSRRCSGSQTAIMRQHGCWMREHRRLCRR